MNGKNLPPDKVEVSGEMGTHRATFAHHNSQSESVEVDTMTENQLKYLLEEAVSYRNPKDKESKSEIFKTLLKRTEEEDEDRGGSFLWSQCKIEHKLSSLQNLSELNDHSDYRRQHSSRHSQKRYPSSSVSSRQREGGSLPSNVNVEPVDQTAPLFNNFKHQQQQLLQQTNDKFGGGSGGSGTGGGNHYYNKSESHSYTTVTEREREQLHGEAKHLLANDCLAQNYESAGHLDNCCSQGTEMKKIPRLPTNYSNEMKIIDQQSKLRSLSPEQRTITMQQYSGGGGGGADHHMGGVSGSSGKTTLIEHPPFPLQNSNAVNSVFPQAHFSPRKCDENANHQPTTSGSHAHGSSGPSGPGGKKQKNKVPKSERNMIVFDPMSIDGFVGYKDIDSLLHYIENNDLDNDNGGAKNGAASALLDAEKTRKREKAAKEKKETGKKLKKYSSLEELSTLSKTEQQHQHEAVNKMHSHNDTTSVVASLRAPAKQLNSKKASASETVALKEKKDKDKVVAPNVLPNKRRERRSWGTEELDFYAIGGSTTVDAGNESDAELHTVIVHTPGTGPPPEKEKDKEKDKEKKEKKKQQQQQQQQPHNELTLNKKKDSLSIVSIESISNSSETAEFLLVTNKKKTKKKSSVSHDDNSAPLFRGGQHHQSGQQPYTNHRRDNNQQQHSYASTNNSSSASSTGSNARNKYPANNASAFANDRDIYMNHHHVANQQDKNNNHHHYHRRKSTSSVPPSDKSDSSDVDSVHSLPIGSTTKLSNKSGAQAPVQQTSSSGGSTPQAVSYADIAKFLNNNNNSNNSANTNNGGNNNGNNNSNSSNNNNVVVDNWPTITSSTTITTTSSKTFNEQQQVDGYMPASNIVAVKQQQNVRTIKTSFPELVDNKNNLNNTLNSSSNSDIIIINNKNTSSNSQNQSNLSNNNNKVHSATNSTTTAKPSYSQSLIEDIGPVVAASQKSTAVVADHPATATLNETVVNAAVTAPAPNVTKNILQKSKSVEHGFYSIEQYPALEYTVVVPITNPASTKPQKAVVSDAPVPNKTGKANSASGQQTNKQIEKQNNSKNAEMSRKVTKNEEVGDTKPSGNVGGKKSKKEKLSAFQQTSDSNSFASSVDATSPTAPITVPPPSVNRPAVEILNYIEPGSNEFTLSFGDFYENEIETLADDDGSPRPVHKQRDGTKSKSLSECSATNISHYPSTTTPTSTTTSPPAKHQLEISNVSHVSTQSDLGYVSSTSPKQLQQQQQQHQQPTTSLKEMMHDNSIIAISNSSQTVIAAASVDASSSVNNNNNNINHNLTSNSSSSSNHSSHMKATSNTKRKSMDQQRTLLPPPHGVAENIVLVGGQHGVNIMVNSNYGAEPQMPTRFLQPPPNLMMGSNNVQQTSAPLQHQYLPPQHIVLPVMMTMVPPTHIPPPTILQSLPASIVVPAGPIQATPVVQAPPPPPPTSAPPPTQPPPGCVAERKLINFDEWNLRFVAPPQHPNPEFVSNNHDRIVDFVGCDWEKIICGNNGNVQYYDGQ